MGMLCLREEARGGAGDGSLFPVTLDDTRLFLSGLQRQDGTKKQKGSHLLCYKRPQNLGEIVLALPRCSAAGWRFTPPPPPLHGMPCLSVRSVSGLPISALSGQFVRQAVDGLIVGQDGADMLLKQSREPQTHTVDLETIKDATDSTVTLRQNQLKMLFYVFIKE